MKPRKAAARVPAKKAAVKAKAKPKNAAGPSTKAKASAKAGGPRVGDAWLRDLGGWHAHALGAARALILEADPDAVEEVKWRKPSNAMRGVLTWSHDGLLCTGEPYKDKVKLTFAKGAALADPRGLFNADDRGATRRAIDLRQGQELEAAPFRALVQAAVEHNAE